MVYKDFEEINDKFYFEKKKHNNAYIEKILFRISNANDRTWALEGNEFHIIETIAELCSYFADTPHIVSSSER